MRVDAAWLLITASQLPWGEAAIAAMVPRPAWGYEQSQGAGGQVPDPDLLVAGGEPDLTADRPGLVIISDKGFAAREFEADLTERGGGTLLRPAKKTEPARPGQGLLKPVRQLIESVNDTLKGQLDLESHGGRTFDGVAVRVAQRILAMTAAI